MAKPQPPLDARLPWSVRLYATPPLPPALWAVLTFGVWTLGLALYCALLDAPFWTNLVGVDLLQISILSFTPLATLYALRRSEGDLDDLRPLLRTTPGVSDTGPARIFLLERRTLTWIGLAGVALALALLFAPGSWQDGKPAIEHTTFAWGAFRSSALGWLVARAVGVELSIAWGFSKLGAHGVEVDWLDQRPLAPFARKGLRSVFLLGLYSALFSLFLLAPWGKPVAVPLLILFPVLCVAALLLPVTGVHRRLVAVRQTELARVDAALRAEAETNLKGGAGDAIDARLSNLVAYRRLVEDAGTWPFDLAIWLRFGLYVSLGLGSWLGGALVERLLGAALD